MIPKKAQDILDFWFKETPAEKRFKKDEAFDKTIREKFLNDYELASQNVIVLCVILKQFFQEYFYPKNFLIHFFPYKIYVQIHPTSF